MGGAGGGSSEMFDLMMEMFGPHEWDEEEEPLSSPCQLEVLQKLLFSWGGCKAWNPLELVKNVWRKKSPDTEKEELGKSEYDAATAMLLLSWSYCQAAPADVMLLLSCCCCHGAVGKG